MNSIIINKLPEIDMIKGMAILGVIFAHMNLSNRNVAEFTLLFVERLQLIFGWCVIAFFFCSGVLSKPTKTRETYIAFIQKRAKRLLLPAILFSISYKIILAILSQFDLLSTPALLPNDLKSFIEFLFYPVGPQFYFLYYLFIITLFFNSLDLFVPIRVVFYIGAFVFTVVYFFIDAPSHYYGADLNLLPFYFFAYLIGVILNSNNKSIHLMITLILITLVIGVIFNPNKIIFIQVGVPVAIWLIFKKWQNFPIVFNKLGIGKNSAAIYVFHAPIVLPIASIICTKFITNIWVIAPILILTVIGSSFMGKLTYKYEFLRYYRF